MDKKYQVFISSTYNDLKEERKIVQEILLSLDCIPAGMESFVAEDKSQLDVIKSIIDLCDYYILIIGGRYGSIDAESQKSFTELEYDYAVSKHIPILVFAVDEHKTFAKNKIETIPENVDKLKAFREKALFNKLGGIWDGRQKLAKLVSTSMNKALKEIERPGWIRGNNVSDEGHLIKTQELIKENVELKERYSKQIEEIDKYKKKIKQLTSVHKNLAFENQKFTIRYKIYYVNGKSKKKSKKSTLNNIFKYLSLSISGYIVDKSFVENKLKEFIKPKAKIDFIDVQTVDILLNQYKELGFIEQISEQKVYKYKLTPKGEKIKNDLNLIEK